MVAIKYADLTDNDLRRIPPDVAAKLGLPTAQDVSHGTRVGFAVFQGSNREVSVLARAIGKLIDIVPAKLRARDEASIDRLVDFYAEGAPRSALEEDLLDDNARLRTEFFNEVPTLTAAEIRQRAGSRSRNASEPASRWKREGRVFAVPRYGADYYPAFQFDADGQPRKVIAEILAALPADMTPWQRAFWFVSENGWLRGTTPAQSLGDAKRVVAAANALAEPAVG